MDIYKNGQMRWIRTIAVVAAFLSAINTASRANFNNYDGLFKTSPLAVQSMFKPVVTITKADGKFVIFEDKKTTREIQRGFRKDAEIQYFNLLKRKAGEIGLSQTGLKKLIKENLRKIDFVQISRARAVVIAGPSASGKSTFVDMLLNEFPGQLGYPRVVTTRPPRGAGQFDEQRIYVDENTFERMFSNGEIYGEITTTRGRYGLYRGDIIRCIEEQKGIIIDLTSFEHARSVKDDIPQANLVVITPCELEKLDKGAPNAISDAEIGKMFLMRISDRGEIPEKELNQRIETAVSLLREAPKVGADAVVINDFNDNLDEIYQDVREKVLSLLEKPAEIKRIEAFDHKTPLGQKEWGRIFIDTMLVRAFEAKRLFEEGKIESPDILIGLDTSWIPEEQMPLIQSLLNELNRLSQERRLDNIIIRRGKGARLANVLKIKAKETNTPNSNIIILGDYNVLEKRAFDSFREGADPEKWALFAGLELPENLPGNNYIRLLEMLTKAVNLWAGKPKPADTQFLQIVQEGKRIFRFIIPEIDPMDYSLLKEIYSNQLKAMKSA